MIVDTHAFKEAFVRGAARGFVVCDAAATSAGFTTKPGFAEIYGSDGCYHIFEARPGAEAHLARAIATNPPRPPLFVREVNVESIRDYQRLAGRKTVFLVDHAGQATQSLRVGDMPLAARTNTPFPGPPPSGLRLAPSNHAASSRTSRRPSPDPFSHVPFDQGEDYPRPNSSRPAPPSPGLLRRLLRVLFAP